MHAPLNVALLVLRASTGAWNDAISVRPFERIGLIGVLEGDQEASMLIIRLMLLMVIEDGMCWILKRHVGWL